MTPSELVTSLTEFHALISQARGSDIQIGYQSKWPGIIGAAIDCIERFSAELVAVDFVRADLVNYTAELAKRLDVTEKRAAKYKEALVQIDFLGHGTPDVSVLISKAREALRADEEMK